MTTTSVCQRCGEPIYPEDRFCGACGVPLTATATPSQSPPSVTGEHSGRLLDAVRSATTGSYEIRGELGRGGMAAVYLAYELGLNRKVAIKVMFPDLAMHEGMVERFKREAQTAAKLDHANIVGIYTVRENDSLLYFAMKYIDGAPLDHILRAFAPMPFGVAQRILDELCDALQYAHDEGVVHRDVKPANVLVDRRGRAFVTDFGIARASESPQLTQTGSIIGTPAYMSPEQCLGHEPSPAADQYALGILAYEMIAGRTPFTGAVFEIQWAHAKQPPPSILSYRPDCPRTLASAIMRMLEKRPEDRWPTLHEARVALTTGLTPGDDAPRRTLADMVRAVSPAPQPFEITPASPVPRGPATPPRVPTPAKQTPASAPPSPAPAPAPLWSSPASEPQIVVGEERESERQQLSPLPTTTAPVETGQVEQPRRRFPAIVPIGAAAAVILAGVVLFLSQDTAHGPDQQVKIDTPVVKADTSPKGPTPEPEPPPPPSSSGDPSPPPPVAAQITALRTTPAGPLRIEVGERRSVSVTATMSDGTTRSPRGVRWHALNTSIVAVGPAGDISGVAAGTTQVEASAGSATVTLDVVVTSPVLGRVVVTAGGDSVRVGQSSSFNARTFDTRSNQIDASITWRSTNPGVASVNARGSVQGNRAGDAYIVATAGTVSDSARVVVFAPSEITRPTDDPSPPPRTVRVADVDPLATSLAQTVAEALSRGRVGPVTASSDFERFVKDNAPIRLDGTSRITRGTLVDNRVDVSIVLPVKWRDFSGRSKTGTVELVATYEARDGAWRQTAVRNSNTPR